MNWATSRTNYAPGGKSAWMSVVGKENPSREDIIDAIQSLPFAVSMVKNPPEDLVLYAAQQNAVAIAGLPPVSEAFAIKLVRANALCFLYMPEHKNNEHVRLAAAGSDPGVVLHMDSPSDDVLCEAVRVNPSFIQNIDKPSPAVQMTGVTVMPSSIKWVPAHIRCPVAVGVAVGKYPWLILHITDDQEQITDAIRINGWVLADMVTGFNAAPSREQCLVSLSSASPQIMSYWPKDVDIGDEELLDALSNVADTAKNGILPSCSASTLTLFIDRLARLPDDKIVRLADIRPDIFEHEAMAPILRNAIASAGGSGGGRRIRHEKLI